MHEDTRENPSNRPELLVAAFDQEYDGDVVQDTVLEIKELMGLRSAVERFHEQVKAAGRDGLDPVAKAIMQVNLRNVMLGKSTSYSLEGFGQGDEIPSNEDFMEKAKGLGEKIAELVAKLTEHAKQFAAKIMSGINSVKNKAEELLKRRTSSKPSNELHDGEKVINLKSPGLLFANGEFCLGDCRAEQEIIKFFLTQWPKYAIDQINRAKKMIGEYDVESGNSDNFKANFDFIGNHQSLVNSIETKVLPGNKSIGFKQVALGPYLKDAEDAKPAPAEHSFAVRTLAEIQGTLRKNAATMDACANLFKEESEVLQHMTSLSKAIAELEGRRTETHWKSAKEDLDTITSLMLDLVVKLKPNYDPIVSYIGKVGAARNAACEQELAAL